MKSNIRAWIVVCAAASHILSAQTHLDLRTQIKSADLSSVGATKPAQTGTVLPSACGVGEVFFLTSASAGTNLMVCASANQWTASGAAAGSTLAMQAASAFAGTATTLNLLPGTYSRRPSRVRAEFVLTSLTWTLPGFRPTRRSNRVSCWRSQRLPPVPQPTPVSCPSTIRSPLMQRIRS